jgi:hypothetical protein
LFNVKFQLGDLAKERIESEMRLRKEKDIFLELERNLRKSRVYLFSVSKVLKAYCK